MSTLGISTPIVIHHDIGKLANKLHMYTGLGPFKHLRFGPGSGHGIHRVARLNARLVVHREDR